MKLIIAIMSNDDSPAVSSALTKENYSVTRLATTGGFLRAGNTAAVVQKSYLLPRLMISAVMLLSLLKCRLAALRSSSLM